MNRKVAVVLSIVLMCGLAAFVCESGESTGTPETTTTTTTPKTANEPTTEDSSAREAAAPSALDREDVSMSEASLSLKMNEIFDLVDVDKNKRLSRPEVEAWLVAIGNLNNRE